MPFTRYETSVREYDPARFRRRCTLIMISLVIFAVLAGLVVTGIAVRLTRKNDSNSDSHAPPTLSPATSIPSLQSARVQMQLQYALEQMDSSASLILTAQCAQFWDENRNEWSNVESTLLSQHLVSNQGAGAMGRSLQQDRRKQQQLFLLLADLSVSAMVAPFEPELGLRSQALVEIVDLHASDLRSRILQKAGEEGSSYFDHLDSIQASIPPQVSRSPSLQPTDEPTGIFSGSNGPSMSVSVLQSPISTTAPPIGAHTLLPTLRMTTGSPFVAQPPSSNTMAPMPSATLQPNPAPNPTTSPEAVVAATPSPTTVPLAFPSSTTIKPTPFPVSLPVTMTPSPFVHPTSSPTQTSGTNEQVPTSMPSTSVALPLCNGLANLCRVTVNRVLFATMHNAMSTVQDGVTVYPNHDASFDVALEAGYRGINWYVGRCNGQIRLIHGLCQLGSSDPVDAFTKLDSFLSNNTHEVVILPTEINQNAVSYNDTTSNSTVALQDLYHVMQQVPGFVQRLYQHPGPDMAWPALQDLIDADQRILFFHYNSGETCSDSTSTTSSCPYGFNDWFQYAAETRLTFSNVNALTNPSLSCLTTRGLNSTLDFFSLNVFLIIPDADAADQVNAGTFLQDHVHNCSVLNNGLDPNLIVVDFWQRGDVLDVVRSYNEYLQ